MHVHVLIFRFKDITNVNYSHDPNQAQKHSTYSEIWTSMGIKHTKGRNDNIWNCRRIRVIRLGVRSAGVG